MSNPDRFTKYRILSLISASLLLLWFFFDANLSKSVLLKDLGLDNPQILSYVLVALLIFFLSESILEYTKYGNEEGWQLRFQFIFIILFSISSLLIAYPKLVINTLLHKTTREDLIIPIVTAIISSIAAIDFRIGLENAQVFYKFRKVLLPIHWIRQIAGGLITLLSLAVLVFLSLGSPPTNLFTRYIVFATSFICIFLTFTPKKKIYGEEKLAKLSRTSDYLDRIVSTEEYAAATGSKRINAKKGFHKKTMREIEALEKAHRKNYKTRFEFLKDVELRPTGNRLEAQPMDDEEKVLRIKFVNKKNGAVLKSADIKFKYYKSALKEIELPSNKKHINDILSTVGLKAYNIQLLNEGSNPNELLFEIAGSGALKELKQVITNRNPDINYIAPDGWSPLLIAVANGHDEIVKYLLKKGAKPNIYNKLGASPLLFSSWYGNESLCRVLLKYGANVNQQDMEGLTPLMRATIRGHSSIAKYLLENGADPQIKDHLKKTALSYAEENKYGDIAKLLRKIP
jgi:hypothetical protein